ncbi:MAG: DUF373 family protein [Candidatus Micrarchaeota archaeon]|nr:DUF373 family protein [Candidatus Micrarchaeota archaeon]
MKKKKAIVICVDRDDDLREKVGISGPVIGREDNLKAASKLALADPEEPDANTMFEAIRILDKIQNENEAQVVTLTGSRKLGYAADKAISEQLDSILSQFPAEFAIVVSDGASDAEILPIIQSRIKVNSTKIVIMKQAKELEKTYFVLLEKLKEPYYARLAFGVPAVILLAWVFSEYLGYGLKPLGIVIGAYLLLKGFGLEESLLSSFSNLRISFERIGFMVYLAAIPILVISFWLGIQEYSLRSQMLVDPVKIAAYTLRSILLLLPWSIILVIAGKVLDLLHENRKYEAVKYTMYASTTAILWFIFTVASDWVVADAYFSDFVVAVMASIALSFVSISAVRSIRMAVASSMKLENKEVFNEIGAYIGKIMGVDRRRGLILVQTALGHKISFDMESIAKIDEKVVVRY